MKKVNVYGVELTELQNMEFSIYKENSNLPAMNTITAEQRKKIVLEWKKNKQLCKDNQ